MEHLYDAFGPPLRHHWLPGVAVVLVASGVDGAGVANDPITVADGGPWVTVATLGTQWDCLSF